MTTTTTRCPVSNPEEPAMNRPNAFILIALVLALAGMLTVSPALATTKSFRQGDASYSGARDTMLQQAQPSLNNGTAVTIGWDGDDPTNSGQDNLTLLRFNDLFGGGASQVPVGAQITQATLTYFVTDVGDTGELHEPLITWEDTYTYTSFCGGDGCNEGDEYGPTTGTAPAAATGAVQVDVTATVQGWSDGSTNRGWIVVPTGSGGVDISSSEDGTTTNRPLLTIRYNEGPPTSALVREPYLQLGTPTSMTIVWRTTTSTTSVVEYGTVFGSYPNSVTGAAGADHYVTITGLSPATRYFYRLGTGGTAGGGTNQHFFVTSPTTGTAQPFRFWAFGDSGICSPIQTTILNSMLTYTATNGPVPDLFLHTGDVAQVSGADDEYTDCHLAYYKDVLRHTPFWPTHGNHDSYSSSCSGNPFTCTGPYYSTFVLPAAGEAGGVASGSEAFYSWNYGNTHFISLSGYYDRSSTGLMAQWLQQDLASPSATGAQWIVVYWHQPPYTKGTHDSDTEIECREMRENINPILEAGGVDLVLNGHSHGYERSFLIDGTYTTPTPTYSTLVSQGHIVDSGSGTPADPYSKPAGIVPHAGTVYSVIASGGQPPGGSHNHPVMYYSESANGSALVDVTSGSLTLTFLRSDGSVRDTVVINKGPQAPRIASTDPPKSSVRSGLPSVKVTFSTDVTGVDAADLTVNGSPATAVEVLSAREYRFTGYTAPGSGLVDVVLVAGGISELGCTGLPFAGDAWTYTIDTSPPVVIGEIPHRGTAIGTLPSVTVTFSKPVFNVTADDMTVNGSVATVVSGNDGTQGPYTFSGFTKPTDGLVTVVLNADGITDDQGRPFAGDTWNYALTRRLIINEFLASNNTAATDPNGEFDDYLEIYNPTRETVDLSGMYLTDDLDSPAQFRIPDGVTIPPLGYLVFWCDGQMAQGPTHTNFNLLRAGEDIGLYDTDANGMAVIDTVTYATQTTDVASGRFPDGVDGFVTMPVTPGAANTISCTSSTQCSALTTTCANGACTGNLCVTQAVNEGGACNDGVACTTGDVCVAGVCNNGTETCGPNQDCNKTTGICEDIQVDPLPIATGDEWRYFKATAEPDPLDLMAWTQIAFDDSGWLTGPSGFGYGVDCDLVRGTTLSDMSGSYVGVYLRKLFLVPNPARVTSLTLTVDYDDAFLVYLNGTEVARSATMGGTPGIPLPYNHVLTSGTNHECSECDGPPCNAAGNIDLTPYISLLVAGNNVIAVRGHNTTPTSTDFTILATLVSTELAGCDINSDCDDGNPCTDDLCNNFVCSNTADNTNFCTDSNPCTDDTCSAGTCSSTPDNGNLCSDGVACTMDACSGGSCVASDACTPPQSCNHVTGICETQTTPVTVTFQDGLGAYTGTVDTFVHAGSADANNSATTPLIVDGPAGSGVPADERQILIRFEQLFQSEGGPIPDGATIQSATLTVWLTNGSVDGAQFHRMLVPWADTATWNSLGSGVQQNGTESVATADVTSFLNSTGVFHSINVTSSVAAWSVGQTNRGWVLISPPAGTSDSWQFSSSEGATAAQRPLLSVTYAQGGCSSDLQCNDDNPCTDDTCTIATGVCNHANDDTNFCSDSVACTLDACSAGACISTDTCTGGQVCNHGTGLCETPPPIDPLPITGGETWSYLKGTAEPTPADLTAWTRLTYDDAAWLAGPSGFGYGTDCAASRGTTLTDMQSPPATPGYVSLYLRKEFWVANPAAVLTLTMTADYDDAFVAYINGTEVARSTNVTGTPPLFGALATGDHECSACGSTCNPVSVIDLTAFRNQLVAGVNVIAIQAHNLTLNSTDFTILPALSSTESTGCTSNGQCDNGLYCDGVETCNLGTGVCQNGAPPNCSDGVACTTDTCDEASDLCLHQASDPACEDGNLCTVNDCDPILGCQSSAVSCDDGIACTTDGCNPATGCTHQDSCTGGLVCNLTSGACETSSSPVTLTFREGLSSYVGTHDTYLHQASAGTVHGTEELLGWDTEDPSPSAQFGLVRFADIFGSGAGQIPPGSTIQSATLAVTVFEAGVTPGANVNEVLVDWDEGTVTYNLFGGDAGVQADEYGTLVGTAPFAIGTSSIDVTASLTAWSAAPADNRGWVFRPVNNNGVDIRSAEYVTTPTERPTLTVTFVPPVSGPTARMSCALLAPTVAPGGNVSLDVLLANLGGMPGVRGYQTQLEFVRTSGDGTLAVSCPGGVTIDETRTDFVFYGQEHFPATNCGLARASSSLRSGGVVVDGTPDYLSDYLLAVSADADVGSTFEIRVSTTPGSELADQGSDPIAFETGPACVLTVTGCVDNGDCDDGSVCNGTETCSGGTCLPGTSLVCNDGNLCTDDSCNPVSGCAFVNDDTNSCSDGNACNGAESCLSGACADGADPVCNDSDPCTDDTCAPAVGCVYTPGAGCGVSGTVRYYRDSGAGSEPSAKPTPSVAIDVDQDALSEDVTDGLGQYLVSPLTGHVVVTTLPKWGVPRASDHNDAVSSFDATLIARHAVMLITLSPNQQIAGDVTGNGSVTSTDAARVAQFAVGIIDHFDVATTRGSDWRFFRCDTYASATNHTCTDPMFDHNPLAGSATDNFYAVLFGDVSGNWAAEAGGFAPLRAPDQESMIASADHAEGARLRSIGYAPPQPRPGGVVATLDGWSWTASAGERRRIALRLDGADGIQGLDLAFAYDPAALTIVGVVKGGLAARQTMVEGRQPGRLAVALYGAEALAGTGEVVVVTVEVKSTRIRPSAFRVSAVANEGAVPVRVEGGFAEPDLRLPDKLLPR